MVKREFWIRALEASWRRRSIVWLSGVRRVGKTVLSQSLPGVEYFDCERPRVRRQMEDPEAFLEGLADRRIVLDEIHRLPNPSELLKLAADHYPRTRILATGSSTLGASARFRDTLAGRKADVWLTPMMSADLADFGKTDVSFRLRRGGLPPFFLSEGEPEDDFQGWMDAYWAKDIQELFRLRRRASFQRLVELLLARSGGIFVASAFAGPCEVSHTTVANYMSAIEATRVVHVIRPFSGRRAQEIVSAPKVYGFDTGFVTYHRGWRELRPEDLGLLWEHYVLNEIHSRAPGLDVRYWRDKQGHEVDFVLVRRGGAPVALECKWSAGGADLKGLRAFRRRHPAGENWVVAQDVDRPYRAKDGDLAVEFLGLTALARRLS